MNLRSTKTLCAAVAFALALPASAVLAAPQQMSDRDQVWQFTHQSLTGVVQAVRAATAKYQDVGAAMHDGYGLDIGGCVSNQDEGAMGVHYVNPAYLFDGAVDVAHPEVLVYEPMRSGGLHLVAVEYLTFAEPAPGLGWDPNHPADQYGIKEPPKLMGQLFDYVGEPNRFRLPAIYNLHVWAWKYNPKGVFSMWNPRVSCADYTES
ncbi:MAG TPA: hypothetical protein VFJ87_03220 [Rhodanobacteraceae bacterium]|nr:hypothetical protein [Rhodanobacteraceae bacterium]